MVPKFAGTHNPSELISTEEVENGAVQVVSGRKKSRTLGDILVPLMVSVAVKSNVEAIF